MKKIICVLVCALLLCALCACDGRTLETFNDCTPDELYDQAMINIAEMDNYEIVHEQIITTSAFVVIKFKIKQSVTVKVDGDDFYQVIESDNEEVMEQNEVPECWYVDEYFYAENANGNLGKQHFDPQEFAGGVYDFSNGDGILLNIPDEMLKETSFHKKGKDVYLEILLDGQEHYSLLMSNAPDAQFDLTEAQDVIYRVYFHEDGTVDRITTTYEFDVVQDGITVKAKVEQISTVKNINSTTIDLPENAGSAQEGNWFYIK